MIKTNKTSYAILGMLSIAPMSGYEIKQTTRQSAANFWSESDGQLYPTLTKLTALGLVTCTTDKASNRAKNTYHITALGLAELKTWLAQEPETHLVRSEFMLQLFFGANVAPKISLEHVQAYRYRTKMLLAQLTKTEEQLADKNQDSAHLPYWCITIQYGIQTAEAKLNWCDDTIKTLEIMQQGEKS